MFIFITTVRAVVVAMLVILGSLYLASFILALRADFIVELVTLGVLLLTLFI